MKHGGKNGIIEAVMDAIVLFLPFRSLTEFLRNDRNQLISTRGKQVLESKVMMERVNEELKKHEEQGISGPVVVDLH